jgi:hypothetical protein
MEDVELLVKLRVRLMSRESGTRLQFVCEIGLSRYVWKRKK